MAENLAKLLRENIFLYSFQKCARKKIFFLLRKRGKSEFSQRRRIYSNGIKVSATFSVVQKGCKEKGEEEKRTLYIQGGFRYSAKKIKKQNSLCKEIISVSQFSSWRGVLFFPLGWWRKTVFVSEEGGVPFWQVYLCWEKRRLQSLHS